MVEKTPASWLILGSFMSEYKGGCSNPRHKIVPSSAIAAAEDVPSSSTVSQASSEKRSVCEHFHMPGFTLEDGTVMGCCSAGSLLATRTQVCLRRSFTILIFVEHGVESAIHERYLGSVATLKAAQL